MRVLTTVTVGCVALLAVAGCASGADPQPATSDSPASVSPTVAPSPVSTADASPGAGTASAEPVPSGTGPIRNTAVPSPSGPLQAAVVKEIRFADHGTFDRVVLEYQGTFGPWQVEYQDAIVEDPTGDPVPLKGTTFLSVVVQNATFDNLMQAEGGVPHVKYTGPRRMDASLANVQEIADSGDFEAVMSIGLGLKTKAGVRAYRLEGPSRLVIDVAH